MNASTNSKPPVSGNKRRRTISLGALASLMNGLGTCWIFVLLILINIDIVGRTLFNAPLRGVTEIVGMTIVACVYLQLAHAIDVGRLTRSDIISSRLEKNHPKVKLALECCYNAVGASILGILFYYSIPMFIEAWNIGEYEGAQGDFTAPVWPVKLIIIIGCLVASLQCMLNSYRCIQRIRTINASVDGETA
jgi:TRAP-type mannitol/chloroaromatic compound transport system permease small subunit